MTKSQIINRTLWNELRDAITITYNNDKSEDAQCLRDYAENISWSDALQSLLDRETANEKQHRSGRPSVPGFSASTAARLILMENVRKGADMKELPRSTAFLILRQTAVEAEVIGYLIRANLPKGWLDAVANLDYAKLMAA